ncbi:MULTISPECIES: hypothetical protein [Pseudomonas]|uniref:Uncharacterized protein n=4 Tax=Pseudomonas syringae group TaxID=136849 RepID=A0AAX1VUG2_PSEAJ|nr:MULTISPECIES: hypothetical protein [Pseudomonas]KPX76548.1 hypothetical protein ALO35_102918 [Pseudomonas amygdali pv. lachrymans]KPY81935.1 hypothetical protein ALO60_102294 [Pseudomonas amygdali pv. tabaci]MCK9710843.1 hypothetical protein [Pseudomonas syringae pv. syringae]MCZ0946594.1 hypothetical protein [Pseudomonas syringae pv. tomato]MDA7013126.1 hypothetical protein [Pseudomonas cerasi]
MLGDLMVAAVDTDLPAIHIPLDGIRAEILRLRTKSRVLAGGLFLSSDTIGKV